MTTGTRKTDKRKARWLLKSCPKCGGDLYEEQAWGERTMSCLACGRTLTPQEERNLRGFAFEDEEDEMAEIKRLMEDAA